MHIFLWFFLATGLAAPPIYTCYIQENTGDDSLARYTISQGTASIPPSITGTFTAEPGTDGTASGNADYKFGTCDPLVTLTWKLDTVKQAMNWDLEVVCGPFIRVNLVYANHTYTNFTIDSHYTWSY